MRKTLYSLIVLALASTLGLAQEQAKKDDSAKPSASSSQQAARTAYKLEYRVYEMEDGKRVNQRDFTSLANATEHGGPSSMLRIGTRVPVSSPGEKPNYLDVGFSVMSQLTDQGGKVAASIRMEMTSFALPEQNAEPRSSTMPVLRSTNFNVETVLTPGKPQLLASIDDLNSKKRMQVEVTATRID
jgi:hypothetical protein